MFDALTPAEWTAIALSLRVAIVAMRRQPALRHPRRLCSRPRPVSRPRAARRARPPAPGHAAGRHRLSAPPPLRPAAARSARFLDRTFGIVLAFSWTGAALACGGHGLPAAGPGDPPVARGGRPPPRSRRGDARRRPRSPCFATITLPLMLPGILAGMVLAFARAPRRIRRDHHLRRQHPGRHPDHPDRDLHLHPGARRRRRRAAPDRDRRSPSPSPR